MRVAITYTKPTAPQRHRRKPAFIDGANTAAFTFTARSGLVTVVPTQTLTPICTGATCTASTSAKLLPGRYEFVITASDTAQNVLSSSDTLETVAPGASSLSITLGAYPSVSLSTVSGGATYVANSGFVSGNPDIGATASAIASTIGFAFYDADGTLVTGSQPFPADFVKTAGPIRVSLQEVDPFSEVSLGVASGSGATCSTGAACTLAGPADTVRLAYGPVADPTYGKAVFPFDVFLTLTAVTAGATSATQEFRSTCTALDAACVHYDPQGNSVFSFFNQYSNSAQGLAVGGAHVWLTGGGKRHAVLDTVAEADPARGSQAAWTFADYSSFVHTGSLAYADGGVWATLPSESGTLYFYGPTFDPTTPPATTYTPAGTAPSALTKPGEGSIAVDSLGNVWFVDPATYALAAYNPKSVASGNLPPQTVVECPLAAGSTALGGSLVAVDSARDRLWFTATDGSASYAGYVSAATFTAASCTANLTRLPTSAGVPQGLAVDGTAHAWFDDGAQLGELTANGTSAPTVVESGLPSRYTGAYGIAYDAKDGNLYATDSTGVLLRIVPGAGVAAAAASALALDFPVPLGSEIAKRHGALSGPNAPYGTVGFQMGAPHPDENGRLWFAIGDPTTGVLNPNVAGDDTSVLLSLDPVQLGSRFSAARTSRASSVPHRT